MLFRSITQRIADYLNQDGKLDSRKLAFCILNMCSSGGLMGLFLLIVLKVIGRTNPYYLLAELLIVIAGSLFESARVFPTVTRREDPDLKPDKKFTALCMSPMVVYLVLTMIFMLR